MKGLTTMKEITKSYLGFTYNKTPIQKGKIEKTLDVLIKYENEVYDRKNFILYLLINEQMTPEKKENVTFYSKRKQDYTKPKTEYRLNHKDGYFITITKTEYDFYIYCVENGFTTVEAVKSYEEKEIKKNEEKEKAEKLEKLVKAEKEEKENKEFENKINASIKNITDAEMKLIRDIFLDINKTYNIDYCKKFVALVKNYDFSLCKEKIISYLHNDNKASIKAFEYLTGLKLPKSYRERMEYLESIFTTDFKGTQSYKAKHNKEELFYIAMSDRWQEVKAESFKKYGIDMILINKGNSWNLSETKSGLMIASAETKEEVIKRLGDIVKRNTENVFKNMIEEKTKDVWERIGINPKYAI